MTVVQQAAGLLSRSPAIQADADSLSLVHEAQQAAATGSAITRQLLAIGRQQNLRPETLALDHYFAWHRTVFERAAGQNVFLTIVVTSPAPCASVDRAHLTAAIVNLVINARDAMTGGGVISIDVQQALDDASARPMVSIAVRAIGCGMTPAVLEHATDPFFSTKGTTLSSGLGLSSVEGFVRQSGGRLQIQSTQGKGTTVTMFLPGARTS